MKNTGYANNVESLVKQNICNNLISATKNIKPKRTDNLWTLWWYIYGGTSNACSSYRYRHLNLYTFHIFCRCGSHGESTKSLKITKYPEFLCIHVTKSLKCLSTVWYTCVSLSLMCLYTLYIVEQLHQLSKCRYMYKLHSSCNDADQYFNAWQCVFGDKDTQSICVWHVHGAWRK